MQRTKEMRNLNGVRSLNQIYLWSSEIRALALGGWGVFQGQNFACVKRGFKRKLKKPKQKQQQQQSIKVQMPNGCQGGGDAEVTN